MAFSYFKQLSAGLCLIMLSACAVKPTPEEAAVLKEMPELVAIPSSLFFIGSSEPERETAYRIDE